MAARIPDYLSDMRDDPGWLWMFLFARTMIGRKMHWGRERLETPKIADFSSISQDQVAMFVKTLRRDGLVGGLKLSSEASNDILAFAERTQCFGNQDRRLEFLPSDHARYQEHVMSGHYFERIEACSTIVQLRKNPLLTEVANAYLGKRARLISNRLWWSFPATRAIAIEPRIASREMLHFDLDDWRMLKFFFYLTPVGIESGPHIYVLGSHHHHILAHQFSLTVGRPAHEVLEAYGEDRLIRVFGEPGMGFVEDSFGYHAGSLVEKNSRLMLEIGFGVRRPNRRRFYGERLVN